MKPPPGTTCGAPLTRRALLTRTANGFGALAAGALQRPCGPAVVSDAGVRCFYRARSACTGPLSAATDADVDGLHIRNLMITFFLRFFEPLVAQGHLKILETPLFRVRNKKETHYCYTEEERIAAIEKLGRGAEITRFKGLGEISPGEFKNFITPKGIRLTPVSIDGDHSTTEIINFYMGKNTPERQGFIIDNLYVEKDVAELKEA